MRYRIDGRNYVVLDGLLYQELDPSEERVEKEAPVHINKQLAESQSRRGSKAQRFDPVTVERACKRVLNGG